MRRSAVQLRGQRTPHNTAPYAERVMGARRQSSKQMSPGRILIFAPALMSLAILLALPRTITATFLLSGEGQLTPEKMASPEQRELHDLLPGVRLKRELDCRQVHSYIVTAQSGQFIRVMVEQKGMDVIVTMFDPGDQKLAKVDSPSGARGPESISVIAQATGSYRLEVKPFDRMCHAGRYEIRIEDLRAPNEEDRMRIRAERALNEGADLHVIGTVESLHESIDKFNVALPLFRTLKDQWAEAVTLTVMGVALVQVGESNKAVDYYKQAIPLRRIFDDRVGEAITLFNLGSAYKSLGELQQALEYYQRALLLLHGLREAIEARTLNNIGAIYSSLGETERALDCFNRALVIEDTGGDRAGQAAKARGETLDALGDLYSLLNEHQKSLDYYNRALSSKRATGDKREEAKTVSNIGLRYWSVGELQKSLEYYDKAILLERAAGDVLGEAVTLSRVGLTYYSLAKPEESLRYLEHALSLHRAVGDKHSEGLTLARMAQVELKLDRLHDARAHIEASLAIVEATRSKFASPELRSSYLGTSHSRYELYIRLLMRMHRNHPASGYDVAALHVSERARARNLLETLLEARADIRQGVDPVLLERERSLRQDLNAKAEVLMRRLNAKHSEAEELSGRRDVEALMAEYDELETQIRIRSPRYAALIHPEPLTADDIQQRVLDENTVLLEYALGDESSYLWAVTPSSIKSFELPSRTEIEAKTRHVYELLSRKAESLYPDAITELSEILLGPVADKLGQKRLLIVSEGALQLLPFGALPVPVGNDRSSTGSAIGRGVKYEPLIMKHEITYLPSASVMTALRNESPQRRAAANKLVVFADPVFNKNDERVVSSLTGQRSHRQADKTTRAAEASDVERSLSDLGITKFERLPTSRREANQITSFISNGQSLKQLDFRASRANLSSIDEYQIVHFATHSLLNNRHPELSGIVLSLVNERGETQDGFLRLHEIYNLKLKSDLVVLSACQTALGKEIKGEGLVGLTRGFMYAGAPRVVATLWKVSDSATAELMTRFYENMLTREMRPAAALRAAQLSLSKEKQWAAPYYWAGFILQGEWR